MTCREIPVGVRDSARSLEDVYTRLGVLQGTDHNPIAPPELIRPDGIPTTAFPYLGGTEGRDFNLATLYDNNQAGLNCVLSSLGYNETRAREIETHVTGLGNNETAITAYLDGLSVGDRRTYSLYSTLQVINYFRTTGNTDRVQNVVSMQEIAAWAWERSGHNRETHQATAAPAVRRLHALLGLAVYLQTEPPLPPRTPDVRAPEIHAATDSIAFAAPQGGWQAGDQIFINGTQWSAPTTGTTQVTIPGSALGAGANTIEVRNGTNTWVSMPVVIQAPEPEEASGETGWVGEHSTELAIGGTAAAAVLVTALAAFFRIRGVRRVEGEARAKAEGEARNARGELGAAELRVRELTDAVAGARGNAEVARMSPEVRAQAEARVAELEGQLREARDQFQDARDGLQIRGRGKNAAETRFDRALEDLNAKEVELAAEQAVVRDMETRNVPADDAGLIQHRERVGVLEGEVRAARGELGEAARHNAQGREARARDAAVEAIQQARLEVRRLEQELASAQEVVARDNAVVNVFEILAAPPRPSTPAPEPAPAPPPVAPVPPPLPPNP